MADTTRRRKPYQAAFRLPQTPTQRFLAMGDQGSFLPPMPGVTAPAAPPPAPYQQKYPLPGAPPQSVSAQPPRQPQASQQQGMSFPSTVLPTPPVATGGDVGLMGNALPPVNALPTQPMQNVQQHTPGPAMGILPQQSQAAAPVQSTPAPAFPPQSVSASVQPAAAVAPPAPVVPDLMMQGRIGAIRGSTAPLPSTPSPEAMHLMGLGPRPNPGTSGYANVAAQVAEQLGRQDYEQTQRLPSNAMNTALQQANTTPGYVGRPAGAYNPAADQQLAQLQQHGDSLRAHNAAIAAGTPGNRPAPMTGAERLDYLAGSSVPSANKMRIVGEDIGMQREMASRLAANEAARQAAQSPEAASKRLQERSGQAEQQLQNMLDSGGQRTGTEWERVQLQLPDGTPTGRFTVRRKLPGTETETSPALAGATGAAGVGATAAGQPVALPGVPAAAAAAQPMQTAYPTKQTTATRRNVASVRGAGSWERKTPEEREASKDRRADRQAVVQERRKLTPGGRVAERNRYQQKLNELSLTGGDDTLLMRSLDPETRARVMMARERIEADKKRTKMEQEGLNKRSKREAETTLEATAITAGGQQAQAQSELEQRAKGMTLDALQGLLNETSNAISQAHNIGDQAAVRKETARRDALQRELNTRLQGTPSQGTQQLLPGTSPGPAGDFYGYPNFEAFHNAGGLSVNMGGTRVNVPPDVVSEYRALRSTMSASDAVEQMNASGKLTPAWAAALPYDLAGAEPPKKEYLGEYEVLSPREAGYRFGRMMMRGK